MYVHQVLEPRLPDHDQPRLGLTRARVLRAGIEIADARGIGTLTMRGLATDLGYEVMSLYNHVANKDDLLGGMVDLVAADIAPPGEGNWREEMRRSVMSAHETLREHPWASRMWFSRMPGPARLDHMESWLRTLNTSGLDPDTAHKGFHALTNHVVGFALQALGFTLGDGEDSDVHARSFLAGLPDGAYPHLVVHVHQHLGAAPGETSFSFVLDLILEGLGTIAAT